MRFLTIVGGLLAALPAFTSSLTLSETTGQALSAFGKRSTVSDILTDIEDATTCVACNVLLVVLKVLAHTGNDNFVAVITDICILAGIDDADVCTGAIGLEGPILAHDLRVMTIGTRTSQLFCLTVFGLCQWPDIEAYTVSMSDKPATTRPAPSGKSPIQVVHISDIHVDLSYEVGASYDCTKNICCRPYTTADVPGNNSYPAGKYGEHTCDSPVTLEESLYSAIESLVPDNAFTIFTGDVVEGAVWLVTDTEVTNDLNDAYTRMKRLGQAYAVVGNHDASPVNSFPPGAVDTTITTQWAYDTMSSDWSSWIGATAAAEADSNYGSYSVLTSQGLRIISVNTNFWYKQNFWLYEETMERDPSGQLAWLVTELEAAEAAGERVWLIGHMPLGKSDAFHDQSEYFDQIIQRFDATISATFYGHTHQDEFEIAYSTPAAPTSETAVMVSYIAPALTPTSGNPTFRVYSVDPVTFAILDYTVYYANISSPTYQSGPVWEKLYSVKEAYGSLLTPPYTDATAELTPAFWHNVTVLFENDDDVFQTWYARRGRDYSAATCTGTCKTTYLCELRASQSQYNCGTVSPGINFKRDTSNPSSTESTHSDCEGSAILPILGAFTASGITGLTDALVKKMGSDWLDTVIPANYTAVGWNVTS
ncbi:sphingomyelin phosphodiesterase [Hyaloscypha bicolor E]|uniref:Sphingomyelin phosphodiesterase n=1 Tax=Hyaloscypha bicolor E TaxID=1095630 RepID=A0A2J6SU42_9HELO|nr:sphingomyelin phosphodiesterase [Hyaloscypha bicolor E]PMD54294.1 sphingomyelin phosphodiesterase [Hyaloscypha bicolor E]